MSIAKNGFLNWWFSMKKKRKIFLWFLMSKIDFESWILALFNTSPLHQFLKFNNFIWVCWFLGKKYFQFCFPPRQLDNPYCHTCSYHLLFLGKQRTPRTFTSFNDLNYNLHFQSCHIISGLNSSMLFPFYLSITQ